VWILIPLPYV